MSKKKAGALKDSVQFTKSVPVIANVDVLVAGGGIAGSMAAIAAAHHGADVMLIDRFGYLGGNMGPGMFSGGGMHLVLHHPDVMPEGLKGIPGEFISRCEGYTDGQLGHDYFRDSQAVSYVLAKMMQENGVRLLLNTWSADAIMDGNRIIGLCVENKSGTQAVRAKVVIDAAGDADVAARTGCPMDAGKGSSHAGMYFAMGDVDAPKFQDFLATAPKPDEKTTEWANELFLKKMGFWNSPFAGSPLLPAMKHAWDIGEYRIINRIGDLCSITVDHGFYKPLHNNIVGAQIGLYGDGINTGDAAVMTRLETESRIYIFETAKFLHHRVPGFENSYLHMISPYFHSRGGRSAVCDYHVSVEEMVEGARFDDVTFITYGHEAQKGPASGTDWPYRQFLPQNVEGLLTAGRSTIVAPPTQRTRWKVLMMGQVAGVAAALAVRSGVTPRRLNVTELQKALHRSHNTPLGDDDRLRELGVI